MPETVYSGAPEGVLHELSLSSPYERLVPVGCDGAIPNRHVKIWSEADRTSAYRSVSCSSPAVTWKTARPDGELICTMACQTVRAIQRYAKVSIQLGAWTYASVHAKSILSVGVPRQQQQIVKA